MSPVVRFSSRAARWAPWVIAIQYRMLAAVYRRAPERAASMLVATRPTRDRAVLTSPKHWPTTVATVGELTQSPAATAHEFWLLAQPWGFSLHDITVPTTIWHGTADTVHPPSMARFVASRISKRDPAPRAGTRDVRLPRPTRRDTGSRCPARQATG